MKRLFILVMLLCLISISTALGDFKVIPMNNLHDRFEQNGNVSAWVNTTVRSRAYLWLNVCQDISNSDTTFDFNWNNELPMAIMGTGDPLGTMNFNNTLYMYVRDSNNLYRQVVICPVRNYMIIEDSGIPYRKAYEDVLYKAISCFELTDTDIQSEIEGIKVESNTTDNSVNSESEGSQNTYEDDEAYTSSAKDFSLPSLIGPFAGELVDVKIGTITYTIHKIFKMAMDKYEEFFDAYIEFMKHTDEPDYLIKYSEFMNKYIEAMDALEKLDKMSEAEKDWSSNESAYFTLVMVRINQKLYSAIGTT